MIPWNQLHDAYGPATEIPELLAEAEASGKGTGLAWRELHERLLHDDRVSSASLAALVPLAEMAERHAPGVEAAALELAARIVAAARHEPAADLALRRRELRRLRTVATAALPTAGDDQQFLRLLALVMAFEHRAAWYEPLEDLAVGELHPRCPRCGCRWRCPPGEVDPGSPQEDADGARMLELVEQHRRSGVRPELEALFGRTTCPVCGDVFSLPDAHLRRG